jgi:hypothetical protein
MKFVPLFVAIFASLPLLAAAVPTQQYDLEIPSEDLTAFVAEDDQASLSEVSDLHLLTAEEAQNCLASTKSEISDDPAAWLESEISDDSAEWLESEISDDPVAWLEYKPRRRKITYTFVSIKAYRKLNPIVVRIIRKDTGKKFWPCTRSLPPTCFPPPLTIPAIRKLRSLKGVIVRLRK